MILKAVTDGLSLDGPTCVRSDIELVALSFTNPHTCTGHLQSATDAAEKSANAAVSLRVASDSINKLLMFKSEVARKVSGVDFFVGASEWLAGVLGQNVQLGVQSLFQVNVGHLPHRTSGWSRGNQPVCGRPEQSWTCFL